MPNTKINPKNRQQGVVGPPNQQQQPLQPNTTSNTSSIPHNHNTTNNIYGISSNNSGSSSNVPFRDPVELFGYSHEMDLALEQKLLSNLKKHSTKILTAATTSGANTTPNITTSNIHTTTNTNTNPTSHLPSQATYSSYTSSSKNTYSHLHHNHPHSTTTPTAKTTSTGYSDIPSHKNRNTTTRTSYTSHPIKNPLPPPTTNTTTTGAPATHSAASNLHTNASSTASTTSNNSSVLLDPDLLTALTQRLSKVEETSKLQQRELYSKEQTLQSQAKELDHYHTQVQQLMAERDRLKNQIHDMETFLNDYGLIWVGGDSDGGDSEDSCEQITNNDNTDTTSGSNDVDEEEESDADNDGDGSNDRSGDDNTQVEAEKTNFKLDMDKIKRSIAELNILAGEGSSTFVKSTTGSPNLRQLKEQSKEIPITFFKNGFMIFAGPFRPYTVPSSIPFLNDICDGYFPYELKDRFPNGVAFKLTDLSSQVYPTSQHPPPPSSFATNSTQQQHLHPYSANVTSSPHTGGSERNIHGMSSLDRNVASGAGGVTTKQFLQKLPVSVIKNGRVVDIRQTITNLTKGVVPQDNNNQTSLIVVPTDAIQHMQARGAEDSKDTSNKDNNTDKNSTSSSSSISSERGGGGGGGVFDDTRKGPSTPRDITTLKLKTETGDTLIIKLKFDDTIGTLRDLVDKYRKDQSTYEIRTAFPSRVYHDPKITLRAAGLIPNATMFLKCIINIM